MLEDENSSFSLELTLSGLGFNYLSYEDFDEIRCPILFIDHKSYAYERLLADLGYISLLDLRNLKVKYK